MHDATKIAAHPIPQVVLRVRGNSMTSTAGRTYPDGSIILVDREEGTRQRRPGHRKAGTLE